MSFQGKLKRYLLILEKVRSKPTFKELSEYLQDDFPMSARTFQRDIEQIRNELGIEIQYDRETNRYHLPDDMEERSQVLPLLERAVLGELISGNGQGIRHALPFVLMERSGALQGLHRWGPLMRAIREKRLVKLKYKRFQVDAVKEHRLRPALLKEYHGRWYVIGICEGKKDPVAFGLDRILDMQVMAKRFASLDTDVKDVYEYVIGVDRSERHTERVVLQFTPEQGKYVKSLPLHSSQFIQRDDAKGLEVVLTVVPNYELRQELLSLGDSVRVLEPPSLAKEIREKHLKAAKAYDREPRKKAVRKSRTRSGR